MADDQDVRDYLEVGLKALGREDLVRDLKAAPDQVLPRTAAWICRMADRGADVAVSMDFVIKSASELAERYRGRIVEGADPVVRQGPTIQDRMDAKASDLIAELDGMIDRCEFEGFNFFLKLKSVDFPPQLASRIADHYAGLAAELAEAELGKDGDLKEAYKRFDKKNLHAYRDFVCGIVEDASRYGQAERKVRATRKAKPVSIEKKLRDFRYMKECPDLKVASVNPADLMGAVEVWLYDAKYRFMTVLRAPEGRVLDVHRTTITGFDAERSMSKQVGRVADKLIEPILKGNKNVLAKVLDPIKTKPFPEPKARVNENTVILRVLR